MNFKNKRSLGKVKIVQLQPRGLIQETPIGEIYQPEHRLEVERLIITQRGIKALDDDGLTVLDIHHLDHPATRTVGEDLISIGFTWHYAAMRAHFGEHMVDGIAGENIIIDHEQPVWLDDLGKRIALRNPQSGEFVLMDVLSQANPCVEFSHFAARSQEKNLSANQLKAVLQFLGKGRRGFLLALDSAAESSFVAPEDEVFIIED